MMMTTIFVIMKMSDDDDANDNDGDDDDVPSPVVMFGRSLPARRVFVVQRFSHTRRFQLGGKIAAN